MGQAIFDHDEFLGKLYRMKHDCLDSIIEAEAREDTNEVLHYERQLIRLNSMIERAGGDLNA
jgi:hypothetical protein